MTESKHWGAAAGALVVVFTAIDVAARDCLARKDESEAALTKRSRDSKRQDNLTENHMRQKRKQLKTVLETRTRERFRPITARKNINFHLCQRLVAC